MLLIVTSNSSRIEEKNPYNTHYTDRIILNYRS